MLFNLINMLRKETNRLLSKGMSNTYLKVTIEKKWHTQNALVFLLLADHLPPPPPSVGGGGGGHCPHKDTVKLKAVKSTNL